MRHLRQRGMALLVSAAIVALGLTTGNHLGAREALAAGPLIHFVPSSGSDISTTTVFGTGYTPNETINVTFSCVARGCGGEPATVTTTSDANGAFSAPVSIHLSPNQEGPVAFGAEGGQGANDDFATANYQVYMADIEVFPISGAPGSTATITGANWSAGYQDSLHWNCSYIDCTSVISLGNPTADSQKSFTQSFTVPNFAPGTYRIGARGTGVGHEGQPDIFVSTTFTVVPATLSPSPTSSPGGSTASVSGTGFGANESVTLKWNCSRIDCSSHYTLLPTGERSFQGVRVLGTATADGSGNFTKSFTVPTFSPGSYPLAAIGGTSNTFVSTPFTVAQPATVTISPNAGHAGSGYSASGTGFRSGETVTVKFNCSSQSCSSLQTLGTATAQSNGSFSIDSVTIPNFSARSYPVAAIGGTSNTLATTTFTVN